MDNGSHDLLQEFEDVLSVEGDTVTVVDEARLRERVDHLVHHAVFGSGLARETARWLLWEAGQALGIYPASIHELYMAIGKGKVPANFTVPAMNVRGMNFNTSRAIFRAANAANVGAMLLEIARSEMGYTDQRPAEYVAAVIAAAIKEGYRGPIFIQGDHFQISAKSFAKDADSEVQAVKDLIKEAINAGFYNIDIDTSTLVDLDHEELDAQQQRNYELCAQLTLYVREVEPEGITVSLGGEIGEVGGHNSTVEELHAFMLGYRRTISNYHPDLRGISKISVQTGTSHGGVVLADGTLADVKVDFETLQELSRLARETYGLGGAVQHGASTLPPDAFDRFPQVGTVEIHLATGFQNLIFDHAPADFIQSGYTAVRERFRDEWRSEQSEEQFLYSSRKKLFGALKKEWWGLDAEAQATIGQALEEQFTFLFEKLNVGNTRDVAIRFAPPVPQHRPRPTEGVTEGTLEVASDLAD